MRHHGVTVIGIAALVALAAGCSSSGSASTTSSTTPSQTTSATPTPTPAKPWTAAALQPALLTLKDLPAGYKVDTSKDSGGHDKVSSKAPGCAALVKIMNTEQPPRTQAFAKISVVGGPQGPFVDEELDGMATPADAQAFVTNLDAAVKTCSTVQMAAAGSAPLTAKISTATAPQLGDTAVAMKATITSGSAAGMEVTTVGVASGRVIVGMSFVAGTPALANSTAKAAVQKAQSTLAAAAG
jgi:hypothetical protein